MSLLMKALEKAAQDRDKTTEAPPHPTEKAAGRELALESVELKPGIKADENISRVPISPRRAASAPVNPPPRASSAPVTGKDNPRSAAQARAATVLNAQPRGAAAAMEWMRARPVYVIGGLAIFFLLLYGGYVYVQIAHPGLLRRTPPPAAVAPTVVSSVPAASASGAPERGPASPAPGDATNSPFVSTQSVFAGRTDAPASQPAGAAAPAVSASKELSGTVPPSPAPAAPVAPRPGTAAAPASAAPPDAPQNRIAVSRGDTAVARINPTVSAAYSALEAGQFDTAQTLYSQVLRSEPANIDALLGLAAIAQQDNRPADAQRHFLAILDVEPRNALAQSGLITLMGRADPPAAESRLKQLLAREPSPPLYFSLGNLYADQGQWPQAQQAYFQAHHLEPRNPDYAYNLAVGLEHLGQQKLALEYYRKAIQLASAKGGVNGGANFDTARIQERITQLATRVNQ